MFFRACSEGSQIVGGGGEYIGRKSVSYIRRAAEVRVEKFGGGLCLHGVASSLRLVR